MMRRGDKKSEPEKKSRVEQPGVKKNYKKMVEPLLESDVSDLTINQVISELDKYLIALTQTGEPFPSFIKQKHLIRWLRFKLTEMPQPIFTELPIKAVFENQEFLSRLILGKNSKHYNNGTFYKDKEVYRAFYAVAGKKLIRSLFLAHPYIEKIDERTEEKKEEKKQEKEDEIDELDENDEEKKGYDEKNYLAIARDAKEIPNTKYIRQCIYKYLTNAKNELSDDDEKSDEESNDNSRIKNLYTVVDNVSAKRWQELIKLCDDVISKQKNPDKKAERDKDILRLKFDSQLLVTSEAKIKLDNVIHLFNFKLPDWVQYEDLLKLLICAPDYMVNAFKVKAKGSEESPIRNNIVDLLSSHPRWRSDIRKMLKDIFPKKDGVTTKTQENVRTLIADLQTYMDEREEKEINMQEESKGEQKERKLEIKEEKDVKEVKEEKPNIRVRIFYWPNKNAQFGHIAIEVEDIDTKKNEYISWAMGNSMIVDLSKHQIDPLILTADFHGDYEDFVREYRETMYSKVPDKVYDKSGFSEEYKNYKRQYNIVTHNCTHSVCKILEMVEVDVPKSIIGYYKPESLYRALYDDKRWRSEENISDKPEWKKEVIQSYLSQKQRVDRRAFETAYLLNNIKSTEEANRFLDELAGTVLQELELNHSKNDRSKDLKGAIDRNKDLKDKILRSNDLIRVIKNQYRLARINNEKYLELQPYRATSEMFEITGQRQISISEDNEEKKTSSLQAILLNQLIDEKKQASAVKSMIEIAKCMSIEKQYNFVHELITLCPDEDIRSSLKMIEPIYQIYKHQQIIIDQYLKKRLAYRNKILDDESSIDIRRNRLNQSKDPEESKKLKNEIDSLVDALSQTHIELAALADKFHHDSRKFKKYDIEMINDTLQTIYQSFDAQPIVFDEKNQHEVHFLINELLRSPDGQLKRLSVFNSEEKDPINSDELAKMMKDSSIEDYLLLSSGGKEETADSGTYLAFYQDNNGQVHPRRVQIKQAVNVKNKQFVHDNNINEVLAAGIINKIQPTENTYGVALIRSDKEDKKHEKPTNKAIHVISVEPSNFTPLCKLKIQDEKKNQKLNARQKVEYLLLNGDKKASAAHYQQSLGRCLSTSLLLGNHAIDFNNIGVSIQSNGKLEFVARNLAGAFAAHYGRSINLSQNAKLRKALEAYPDTVRYSAHFIEGIDEIVSQNNLTLKNIVTEQVNDLIEKYGSDAVTARIQTLTTAFVTKENRIEELYNQIIARKFSLKKMSLKAKLLNINTFDDKYKDLVKAHPVYFSMKSAKNSPEQKLLDSLYVLKANEAKKSVDDRLIIKLIHMIKSTSDNLSDLVATIANCLKFFAEDKESTELQNFLNRALKPPYSSNNPDDRDILIQACDEAYHLIIDKFARLAEFQKELFIAQIGSSSLIFMDDFLANIEKPDLKSAADSKIEAKEEIQEEKKEEVEKKSPKASDFYIVNAQIIQEYIYQKVPAAEIKNNDKWIDIVKNLMLGGSHLIDAIDLLDEIPSLKGIKEHFSPAYVYLGAKLGGHNKAGEYGGRYKNIKSKQTYLFKKDTDVSKVTGQVTHLVEKDISEFISAKIMNMMVPGIAPNIGVAKHHEESSPYISSEYFKNYSDLDKDIYDNYYQIPLLNDLLAQLEASKEIILNTEFIQKIKTQAAARVSSLSNRDACYENFNLLLDSLKNKSSSQAQELIRKYLNEEIPEYPKERIRALGSKQLAETQVGRIFRTAILHKKYGNRHYEDLEECLVVSLFVADFDTHVRNLGVVTIKYPDGTQRKIMKRIDLGAALKGKHFENKEDVNIQGLLKHIPILDPSNHIREFPSDVKYSDKFADAIDSAIKNLKKSLNDGSFSSFFNDLRRWERNDLIRFAKHIGLTNKIIESDPNLPKVIEDYMTGLMYSRIAPMHKLYLEIKISSCFVVTKGKVRLDPVKKKELDQLIENDLDYFKQGKFTFRGKKLARLNQIFAARILKQMTKEVETRKKEDEKQKQIDRKEEKVELSEEVNPVKAKSVVREYKEQSLGYIIYQQLDDEEQRPKGLSTIINIAKSTDDQKQKEFFLSLLSLTPQTKLLIPKLEKSYSAFHENQEREFDLKAVCAEESKQQYKIIKQNKAKLPSLAKQIADLKSQLKKTTHQENELRLLLKQEKQLLNTIKEASKQIKKLSYYLKADLAACQKPANKSALKSSFDDCYAALESLTSSVLSAEQITQIKIATEKLCKSPDDYPGDLLSAQVVKTNKEAKDINLKDVHDLFVGAQIKDCLFVSPKLGGANDPGQRGGNYIKCYQDQHGRVHVEKIFFKQATDHGMPNHRENIAEVIAGNVMMDIIGENAAGVIFAMHKGVPEAKDYSDADADEAYVGSIFLHGFKSAHEAGYEIQKREELEKKRDSLIKKFEVDIINAKYSYYRNTAIPAEYLVKIHAEAVDRYNALSVRIPGRKKGLKSAMDTAFKTGLTKLINHSDEKQKYQYQLSLGRGLGVSLLLGNYQIHSENIGLADIAGMRQFGILDYGGAFRRIFSGHDEVEKGEFERAIHPSRARARKWWANYIDSYPKEVRLSKGFIEGLDQVVSFDPMQLSKSVHQNIDYAVRYYGEKDFIEHFAKELDTTGKSLKLTGDTTKDIVAVKDFLSLRLIERQFSLKKFAVKSKLESIKAGYPDYNITDMVNQHPVYMQYINRAAYKEFVEKNKGKPGKFLVDNFLLDNIVSKYYKNIHQTAYIFYMQIDGLLSIPELKSDKLISLKQFFEHALKYDQDTKSRNYDFKNHDDVSILMQACDEAFTTIKDLYRDNQLLHEKIEASMEKVVLKDANPVYAQFRYQISPHDVKNPLQLILLDKIRDYKDFKDPAKMLVQNFRLQVESLLDLKNKKSKYVIKSLEDLKSLFDDVLRNNKYDFTNEDNQNQLFQICDKAYRALGEAYQLLPQHEQEVALENAERLWPLSDAELNMRAQLEQEYLKFFADAISTEENINDAICAREAIFIEYKNLNDGVTRKISISLAEAERLGFTFDKEKLDIRNEQQPFSHILKLNNNKLQIDQPDSKGMVVEFQSVYIDKRVTIPTIKMHRDAFPDITFKEWIIYEGAASLATHRLFENHQKLMAPGMEDGYTLRQGVKIGGFTGEIRSHMLSQSIELIRGLPQKRLDTVLNVHDADVKKEAKQETKKIIEEAKESKEEIKEEAKEEIKEAAKEEMQESAKVADKKITQAYLAEQLLFKRLTSDQNPILVLVDGKLHESKSELHQALEVDREKWKTTFKEFKNSILTTADLDQHLKSLREDYLNTKSHLITLDDEKQTVRVYPRKDSNIDARIDDFFASGIDCVRGALMIIEYSEIEQKDKENLIKGIKNSLIKYHKNLSLLRDEAQGDDNKKIENLKLARDQYLLFFKSLGNRLTKNGIYTDPKLAVKGIQEARDLVWIQSRKGEAVCTLRGIKGDDSITAISYAKRLEFDHQDLVDKKQYQTQAWFTSMAKNHPWVEKLYKKNPDILQLSPTPMLRGIPNPANAWDESSILISSNGGIQQVIRGTRLGITSPYSVKSSGERQRLTDRNHRLMVSNERLEEYVKQHMTNWRGLMPLPDGQGEVKVTIPLLHQTLIDPGALRYLPEFSGDDPEDMMRMLTHGSEEVQKHLNALTTYYNPETGEVVISKQETTIPPNCLPINFSVKKINNGINMWEHITLERASDRRDSAALITLTVEKLRSFAKNLLHSQNLEDKESQADIAIIKAFLQQSDSINRSPYLTMDDKQREAMKRLCTKLWEGRFEDLPKETQRNLALLIQAACNLKAILRQSILGTAKRAVDEVADSTPGIGRWVGKFVRGITGIPNFFRFVKRAWGFRSASGVPEDSSLNTYKSAYESIAAELLGGRMGGCKSALDRQGEMAEIVQAMYQQYNTEGVIVSFDGDPKDKKQFRDTYLNTQHKHNMCEMITGTPGSTDNETRGMGHSQETDFEKKASAILQGARKYKKPKESEQSVWKRFKNLFGTAGPEPKKDADQLSQSVQAQQQKQGESKEIKAESKPPVIERKVESQQQQQQQEVKPQRSPAIAEQSVPKDAPALSAKPPEPNEPRSGEEKVGRTANIEAQRQTPAQILELIQTRSLLSELNKTVDIKSATDALKETELSNELKTTIKETHATKTYQVKETESDAGGVFAERRVGSNYTIYCLQSPTKQVNEPDDAYFEKLLGFAHKQLMAFIINKGRTIYVRTNDPALAKAYMAIGLANKLQIYNYSPCFETEAKKQDLIAEIEKIEIPTKYLNLKYDKLDSKLAETNGMKDFVTWCGQMQTFIAQAQQDIANPSKKANYGEIEKRLTTDKSVCENLINEFKSPQEKDLATKTSSKILEEIDATLASLNKDKDKDKAEEVDINPPQAGNRRKTVNF